MPIKNRQKFLAILTVSVVGLLVADSLIRPPLVSYWKARSAQIAKYKAQVADGERLRNNKDALRARWTEVQASTLSIDQTAAEQQLFSGLNRWSEYSNISIDNLAPQWKIGSDPAYKTIECRVDASGRIDQLSQFLYAVETDPIALKVQSIEMTSKNADGSVIGLGVQLSALVLTGVEAKK